MSKKGRPIGPRQKVNHRGELAGEVCQGPRCYTVCLTPHKTNLPEGWARDEFGRIRCVKCLTTIDRVEAHRAEVKRLEARRLEVMFPGYAKRQARKKDTRT